MNKPRYDSFYEPTGLMILDEIGCAFTHAQKHGVEISRFLVRLPAYKKLQEFIAVKLATSGQPFSPASPLDFNGIPIEYMRLQEDDLKIEYKQKAKKTSTDDSNRKPII